MLKLHKCEANKLLAGRFPDDLSLDSGCPVVTQRWDQPGFSIRQDAGRVLINHQTRNDYYRALGVLIRNPETSFLRSEPPFSFRGLMIDASRNGVLKPSYLKEVIIKLALLGINYLSLYTEDTYAVSGHQLIGYKRGAYTKAELKDLEDYAAAFGVEMFPCIQTLGHLSQVLKFERYQHIKATNTLLSTESDQTYDLLALLVKNASAPYKSKLIHVGMDETWGLGTGKSLERKKGVDPRRLYLGHLQKVAEICLSLGLRPIIWGDMLVGTSAFPTLTPAHARMIPPEITLDCWNYELEDKAAYKQLIGAYRSLGFEPIVSPGMWNWNRLWGLYPKVERTMVPFMQAAREEGIKRVLMTMWGDDGQEAPWASNLPGLALYAEYCWKPRPEQSDIRRAVEKIGGDCWDSFLLPTRMDYTSKPGLKAGANMGKCFLYDDPLLRIFASHVGKAKYNRHYEEIRKQLEQAVKHASPRNKPLFEYAYALADCLSKKADLGNNAYEAYRAADREGLTQVLKDISRTVRKVSIAWKAHRRIWLEENKPFGLEVIDGRYGGCLLRLQAMWERINQYLTDQISMIEEYEERPHKIYPDFQEIRLPYNKIASLTTEK